MTQELKRRERILEWLRDHRDMDPTFWEAVLAEWRALLSAGIVSVIGLWFLLTDIDANLGIGLFGIAFGGLTMHLALVVVRLRAFGVYRDVADWAKVQEELERVRGGA